MKFASHSLRHVLGSCGRTAESRLRRFAADTRGDVAILFGLMTLVIVMLIGLAVDYGRLLNARHQTLEATDAAVLAGARALQTNGGDQAGAIKVAQAYYKQAVQSRIPVVSKSDTINFAVTDSGTAVVAKGNASIATPFMSVAGVKTLPLLRANGMDYAKAVLAVGGNAELNLEVSLMLDVTRSMQGQKLTDLKAAASDLVNIVVWKDQSKFTSRVAIVPFAEDVRLPGAAFKTATGATSTTNPCVVERTGSQKYTDAAPKSGQYVMAHKVEVKQNGKTTYNPECDVAANAEVLPLTSDKNTLLSKINGLSVGYYTAGHIGTAWAWYMLAPNWASLWASSSKPAAYNTKDVKKIAVLMTDGEYNVQYDANGVLVDQDSTKCSKAANGCSSVQALSQCTAMKAKGIEVYTVGFQLTNSTAIDTLKKCATDADHFYNSSTGDALKAAFRDIALKISTLYLSQ
ncbi:pilus assembly protein [Hyphomicrobium sp.]|uniref:TadE/TadG family type IV pilus assembly protein n=1 Tax=Hyphomicrobium sp. TaxID=82 RepID=UPI002D770F42|nr:pilus assembly protein [Hyphomicrobium sp.]HET6388619.1 pilus assembly protein [Hyphomicrobium sp.]